MSFKNFTSDDKKFSIELPNDWEEYDDGDEKTYAFFNASTWSGNLRITAFRWPNSTDNSRDKAAEFIEEDLAENDGAIKVKLGEWVCTYYKKDLVQDGENLLIYYWSTGKLYDLFIYNRQRARTNRTKLGGVGNGK